ncbi:MAG: hypothetical protein NW241_08795 [Bacteroidia bacterium]|nr:hypothetical protein [Bacteroidia bacterium]
MKALAYVIALAGFIAISTAVQAQGPLPKAEVTVTNGGRPQSGVTVQLFIQFQNTERFSAEFTTDSNGRVIFDRLRRNQAYIVRTVPEGDEAAREETFTTGPSGKTDLNLEI